MIVANVESPDTKQLARIASLLKLTDGERWFYQKHGYLQIPGAITQQAAEQLRREVMDIMHAIGGFDGSKLKQTAEFLEGSLLHQFVLDANLKNVAEQLLGGPSSLYVPFTAVKGSGGGKFHFHQDNNYTRFEPGMGGINLWFALVNMTPENGCLMIVPGSHLGGQADGEDVGEGDQHRKVKVEPREFLPLRMLAGDCVAFSRLTIHGSGPNTTPYPRVGYALQYFRNDIHFFDRKTGERKPLLGHSPQCQNTMPVKKITIPTGKIDGH
jgi:phytanoyl-CoA hydroxylase